MLCYTFVNKFSRQFLHMLQVLFLIASTVEVEYGKGSFNALRIQTPLKFKFVIFLHFISLQMRFPEYRSFSRELPIYQLNLCFHTFPLAGEFTL